VNEAAKRVSMRDPLKKHFVDGRPNIRSVMDDALREVNPSETVAVGACGPSGWVNEVRKVVVENIKGQGPSVSIFCEQFG
jgi:hypothetical protein